MKRNIVISDRRHIAALWSRFSRGRPRACTPPRSSYGCPLKLGHWTLGNTCCLACWRCPVSRLRGDVGSGLFYHFTIVGFNPEASLSHDTRRACAVHSHRSGLLCNVCWTEAWQVSSLRALLSARQLEVRFGLWTRSTNRSSLTSSCCAAQLLTHQY